MNLIDKLPHKAPALLLESVLCVGDTSATCKVLARPHPSLAPDGMLPSALGLDVMAQAAAILMIGKYPEADAQGMLVQCRELHLFVDKLDTASGLTTTATVLSSGSVTGLYQFAGTISDALDTVLCSATFLIMTKGKNA